ncbi:hypothetical protein [Sinorhizobium fredii]|uniref:hypothetical protein n=1 Tax=Rhizobium fredii TaxID=380 RepID=UPI001FCBA054|nr:hypothetical protein [Sinorhizobium fredii]
MPRDGAWWLSERLYWVKIRVKCECGVKRQYDAKTLFDRIGDLSMPSLLGEISAAIGCEKSANVYRDRCKLTYEMPPGEFSASRRSRLVMRPQPATLTRSLSRTFPNGATSCASAGAVVASTELTGARWPRASAKGTASFGWRHGCDVECVKIGTETPSSLESPDDKSMTT